MPDVQAHTPKSIDPQIAAMRWEQGLALTQVFTDIWLNHPLLAKKAGIRIQEFVMSRDEVQRRHLGDLT
jgi:hypothetical protein